jgi:glucose-6-phosphate 1-dehydrogenase
MVNRLLILGATGDLTSRYLLPALARLQDESLLPSGFRIGAVSREDMSTQEYRNRIAAPSESHAAGIPTEARRKVLGCITYHRADATKAGELRPILSGGPSAVYLALPPAVFQPAVQAVIDSGPGQGIRVVLEKPHGENLESVRSLNRLLHENFPEESVFRIDHFLGHQTVQNILGVRFANRIFEPVWNCNHIEYVEIRFDETLALEGRAGYYDRTGALIDMIQNHLLQLFCFLAMEPPMGFNPRDLRDRKVELLRSVRNPGMTDLRTHSVRARYSEGHVDGKHIPAYLDEQGVDAESNTETFAALTLMVDNWRWYGIPFVLRSGKALARNRQEISIRFRQVPFRIFRSEGQPMRNILRLSFDPDRMSLGLNLNGEGEPFDLQPAALSLELTPQELPAYARLLLDVFEGDTTFSIRDDEAEESWRIVEPVVEAWKNGQVPMREYPAGSDFEP